MKIALLHSTNDVYGASGILASEVVCLAGEGQHVSVVVPTDGPLGALPEILWDRYVVHRRMGIIGRGNPRKTVLSPQSEVASSRLRAGTTGAAYGAESNEWVDAAPRIGGC